MKHNLRFDVIYSQDQFISYAKSKIPKDNEESNFFVVDLAKVVRKFHQWKTNLPRVQPFYAVKCNFDPAVIKILDCLGTGFDCASLGELNDVLEITNCDKDNIIYANPCKDRQHLEFAKVKGIKKTTFDSSEELEKIKLYHPDAEVVMRIKTYDDCSTIQLSKKYGVDKERWESLILKCKELNLNLIGVCFHIGSGSYDTSTISKAIKDSSAVFDLAEGLGYQLKLLDIEGGFPGNDLANPNFEEFAKTINLSLDQYFKHRENIRIIAEPGRFFIDECYSMFVKIISKKVWEESTLKDLSVDEELVKIIDKFNVKLFKEKETLKPKYYIQEGTTRSFSNSIYEGANFVPLLVEPHENEIIFESCIYGNSGCENEIISKDVLLPLLRTDEYIYFERMGSYTVSLGFGMSYNGYALSALKHYCWIRSSLEDNKMEYEKIFEII